MMSSKPTPRFMDPVAHAKLPRLETTLGTKSGDMPGYSHEEPVNYSGAYFSYCLSGPEGTDLPPHWSPPGACLQRSPIVHPTSAGRPLSSQITQRPENMAHCVEGSSHAATRDLAANQQSSYYDRVPEKQGPSAPGIHAPTAVRKLGVGGATVTPPRGSPVGLAVPKPIYGHNPCCTEHGCTSGPCYSMERGVPRVHPNAYNEEWMLHYGPLSLLQRKEREALLQLEQSSVRFPLRETAPEGYHAMRPTRPMRFPSFIEPNYGNFPYASAARSPLSPSSDLFHRLQFPSKVYHSLPPPPSCTYEEMQQMALAHPGISPKMYPDRPPPAPRYTQLPQRPVFYYSQGNVELESPSPYNGSSRNLTADPPPTVSKQVSPNPLGPCLRPQPSLSDYPGPCPAGPMNSSFPRNCDLSHFQMYRAHAGMAGQKRTFAEGPGASLLVRHADRPVDYSSQGAWVTSSPRELCKGSLSPGAFHPVQQSLSDYRGSDHLGSVGKGRILGNHRLDDEHSGPKAVAPQCSVAHHEGGAVAGAGPARHCSSVERTSSLCANSPDQPAAAEALDMGQTDRSEYAYETQAPNRPQELKGSDPRPGERLHSPPSPPMPVINKVFSLAPYKAYLQASGMLPLQNGLQNKKARSNERDSPQGLDEPTHKPSQTPSEANPVHMLEPHQIKTEKVTLEETDCSLKSDEIRCEGQQQGLKETIVKEEDTEKVTSSSDSVLDLRVKKGEFNVFTSEVQTSMHRLSSTAYGVDSADRHGVTRGLTLNRNGEHSVLVAHSPKPVIPSPVPQETKVFQQIPPQYVNRSAFKIIVPDVLSPPAPSHAPEVPQPAPEVKPPEDANRQARHRFLEMHQYLFRLISASVSQAPEQELRAWLANLEPQETASCPAKAVPVTGLLAAAAKEAWLRCKDIAATLSQVVGQLEDYVASRQCPFPHVTRAGTLFIPMLVVKEYLFPQVLGALIDRVLQEHHVELRPTTLSEERHLMQLQKRACSSKLRRLLSLKHLPDIYPDVLNLYYHACVGKRLGQNGQTESEPGNADELLGIVLGSPVKTEKTDCSEEMEASGNGTSAQSPSDRPNPLDPPKQLKHLSRGSLLKKRKRKGRQRSASKRKFLGKEKPIQGEKFGYPVQSESWSIVNSFSQEEAAERSQSPCSENVDPLQIKVEEHSPMVTQGCNEEPESTWGPVTSDDLSSGNSDTETERASMPPYLSQTSETPKSPAIPKSHSGMILKLRKVLFSKGPFRRDPKPFQPFLDHGQPVQLAHQVGEGAAGEGQEDQTLARRMRARVAQRRRRVVGFSKVPRPTRSSSKVLPVRNSPMQLKYLPHLSGSHSSHRRRRWVLRSAGQTARGALKNRYPDLVGKRIRHLYEENDKSEVWYRGVVVRVHEPHMNPLKTVFEVKYDSEPEWQYYLELLMDYKKGWLKVED